MILLKKSTYLVGVFLALLWLASSSLYGQTTEIDSLKKVVQTGKRDTAMVNTFINLSLAVLSNEDIENSLAYAEKANELAKEINFRKGQAYAQKYIGLAQYYQGNYLAVMDYWTQSLESFEAVRDTSGMANILNNLGSIYLSQGGNDKALDYYLKSLYFAEKIKDTFRITSVLPNIGAVYGDMKNYEKALEYFKHLERYLSSLEDPQIKTYYLMGVGEIYNKMQDYKSALDSYQKALPLSKNTAEYAHVLKELGAIQFKVGNVEKAIDNLNLAYEIAKEKNQQLETLNALIGLGNIYQNTDYSKTVALYEEAELLATELETKKGLRDIYDGLSKTYAIAGDYNKAYAYQTLFQALKDSIYNLETDDTIRGLQFDFENQKNQDEIGLLEQQAQISELTEKRQKYALYATISFLVLVFVLAIGSYKRYRYVKKTNKIIEVEKERSEKLLLNILPEETALELKEHGKVAAKKFESATILFSDFKGFTSYAQNLSPEDLVRSVDYYFSKFDQIMDKYDLEKIKTVGDAYMCAGGLPFPTTDHPLKMVEAAFEIAQVMEDMKTHPEPGIVSFDVRIGINTGPVVAGVVGLNKFAYDIWGDAVNVASRMESMSEPGRINISENTYQLVKDVYDCEFRGKVAVKNKGKMDMYFVNGRKIIRHHKTKEEVNV